MENGVHIIGVSSCGEEVCAAAGRISTQKGTALEIFARSHDGEKNANLIGKVTASGHTSTVEHVFFNLAFNNVSVVVEQFMIEFRLASFTVKSRRYVDFADSVDLYDVRELLERQIAYNMAIAEEGLRHSYGANIGKTLLRGHEHDLDYVLRAWAAAGSDARMNGCEMPVIINSGSGNQGITTSVPVIVYARETGASEERLLRALSLSNLITIHLKTGIGRLSAYCGAVSAGAGAASGIAYLQGGGFDTIAHVIVNTVAVTSGIVCDGAKASCAAKIAAAVDAGLLGLAMVRDGNEFYGGDGIVKKGVENTIAIVGRLARNGMLETDREIIRLMLE